MGERKVQAKYYPPDFDPSKLPRIKKKTQNDDAVRFMLPMSVRCETCGEFMGAGLKFNARKSDTGDNYLGIKIFRFSMKCKSCPATFTIRTDPENRNYSCESGVRRNYEPWREAKASEEEGKEERRRQDEDAIQALENKTKDAKQEMEDLDALDELKSLNAKRAKVDLDSVLAREKAAEEERAEEIEREILNEAKLAFQRKSSSPLRASSPIPISKHHSGLKKQNLKPSETGSARTPKLKVLKIIKKVNQNNMAIVKKPLKAEANGDQLVGYGSSSSSEG